VGEQEIHGEHWLGRMLSFGMLQHVALVRTNVLEECIASIIMLARKPQKTLLLFSTYVNSMMGNIYTKACFATFLDVILKYVGILHL
jgi:hypothetical protein